MRHVQPQIQPNAARGIWSNYQVPFGEYFSSYIVFSEPWGDLHRHVIFLSPNFGLLSAFLYGATSKRNPLRATSQAFSFGRLRLRRGKRTGQKLQIADWELERPSFLLSPPSPEVFPYAGLWSELLLYSHGLGHYGQHNGQGAAAQGEAALLFAELRSLLSSILHFGSRAHCRLATLRFFWQFLLLEGFHPGLGRCHSCSRSFHLLEEQIFFSASSELLCECCAPVSQARLLGAEELNLLCWAEQDLANFVRQDEFFFGNRCDSQSRLGSAILESLHNRLEILLGRSLLSAGAL